MNPKGENDSLKHLYPGWFAVVMGLCGTSLAWHRAVPAMGEPARWLAGLGGVLAALTFVLLTGAFVLRAQRFPQAWADDKRHPVRHTFISTMPISGLLLATVGVASGYQNLLVDLLWQASSLAQLAVTVWVLSRWLKGNQAGGMQWASFTPAMFIPVVGNVLVPLAGIPLGHQEWAAAQFGIGALFWPVVLVLMLVRIAIQGMWPDRLLPASFIVIAPPAAIGLSLLQMGAPLPVVWAMWGIAVFCLLWSASLGTRIASLPFDLPHWGMTFPLAALTALTLRMPSSPLMSGLGMALLALTTLIVGALLFATFNGLRKGTLLVAEALPQIVPVAAKP